MFLKNCSTSLNVLYYLGFLFHFFCSLHFVDSLDHFYWFILNMPHRVSLSLALQKAGRACCGGLLYDVCWGHWSSSFCGSSLNHGPALYTWTTEVELPQHSFPSHCSSWILPCWWSCVGNFPALSLVEEALYCLSVQDSRLKGVSYHPPPAADVFCFYPFPSRNPVPGSIMFLPPPPVANSFCFILKKNLESGWGFVPMCQGLCLLASHPASIFLMSTGEGV